MELPKISRGEGGMLSGIKSKLGFANDKQDSYDEDYYYDDNRDFDDGYDSYNTDYNDDYDDVSYRNTGRSPRSKYQRTRDSYGDSYRANARDNRSVSSNLVDIDDVRTHARTSDAFARDTYTPSSSRNYSSSDSARSVSNRSSYSSTSASTNQAIYQPLPNASSINTSSTQSRSEFDPYDAFSSGSGSMHTPSRSLSVLRPSVYGEAEQVARYLRAGDMVILCLKNTPSDVAKRILDFSFGAACMVDARVECVGDKVFAFSTGVALTDDEKSRLISQGVL